MSRALHAVSKLLELSWLISLVFDCVCCHTASVVIRSGGAILPLDVYKMWKPVYQAHRFKYASVDFTYTGIGSLAGFEEFFAHRYDFAGLDLILSADMYRAIPDIQAFPVVALPLALVYNIPELSHNCTSNYNQSNTCLLSLTQEALVGIFNGTITKWNDPLITKYNAALRSVNESIVVVVRQDPAGSTETFTRALSSFSPAWNATYSIFESACRNSSGHLRKWNSTMNIRCGFQQRGLAGLVMNVPYSIGYLGSADARGSNLPESRIRNSNNIWTSPGIEGVQAAMDALASQLGDKMSVSLVDSPGNLSYPICAYSYFVIRKTNMTNCTVATELYRLFDYLLNDSLAKSIAVDLVKVPLSERVLEQVQKKVLLKWTCKGKRVRDLVDYQIAIENGLIGAWKLPLGICLGIVILCLLVGAVTMIYVEYHRSKDALRNTFIVSIGASENGAKSNSSFGTTSVAHAQSLDLASFGYNGAEIFKESGCEPLLLRHLCDHFVPVPETLRWKTRKLFVKFCHQIHQHNVIRLMGITFYDSSWRYVAQCPSKGMDWKAKTISSSQ